MKFPSLLALALVASITLTGCGQSKSAAIAVAPMPVQVVTAREPQPADFAEGPRLLATIKGDVETSLSFKTGGIVEWIGPDNEGRGWREGQFVRAGTVLARLVQTEFKSAEEAAASAVERERRNWDRMQKLSTDRVVSAQDVDKAKAAWESAEADLRKTRQALTDSIIAAPQDGWLLARSLERGELAAPGSPIVRFGDFRRMSLTLAVPDRWVAAFTEGREVAFTVSAFEGRPFVARVTEVGVAARANDRLFKVELKVDNADGALRSGMTGSVPILGADPAHAATGANALLVPLSALTTRPAAKGDGDRVNAKTPELVVMVADLQNVARERTVRTGEIVGSQILILGGELRAGERVITMASDDLFDGAPVAPRAVAPGSLAAR